ncbi:uncharacterized protein LOC132637082 [Lycium barbarum]|uniref:uncharacterized protein LOC132637082 n=1 Tax=Lycium barbarum TaxID=112863 RepID=UPI00293E3145|nr:uncharacterized protein LOC132637082 [Lycium barbarum]
MPTMDEVKEGVFSINPESALGPDGLNALFYQASWTIIAKEVHEAVVPFFEGENIPKFFTHTCLVMIPKVDFPQHLTDLRPISLCNVSSKIFAKMLNARLPKVVSINQSGFIKGRFISENIQLAQEIIKNIKKPQKKWNVVMKLDIAKAYDRVAWLYLYSLMERLGFSKEWISLIKRHISNNWYSLIVNRRRYGFFKSENGLRQRDPISLSLFVLSAELLSIMLNNLQERRGFTGFQMCKQGPLINHLEFADDLILFSSGRRKTINMIMRTLAEYETAPDKR